MNLKVRKRHKETAVTVLTGLLVNYPVNLVLLFIFIDYFGITDPLLLGTIITFLMTFVAYTRIYLIRRHYEKKNL